MQTREFRIPSSSIAGIPRLEKAWKSTETAHGAYIGCAPQLKKEFLKSLSPGQRAVIAIGILRGEVDNGGFGQFFWNSSCEITSAALEGLWLVGATKHRKIAEDAIKASKLQEPDFVDERKRRGKLKRLGFQKFFDRFDERFYRLNSKEGSDLDSLIHVYYQSHEIEFHISEAAHTRALNEEMALKKATDYRIEKPNGRIAPEEFTWMLIEKLWDNYWEELKAGRERFKGFIDHISAGQRALVAIDILNKNVLHREGVLSLAEIGLAEIISEELGRSFSLLAAKPYAKLWSKWQSQGGDLIRLSSVREELGKDYTVSRNSQGKEAAADLGKKFMAANKAVRERRAELEETGEKINERFKALLSEKKTAIETFIGAYVEKHPNDFFLSS